jgi:hypothetical protein
VHIAVRCDRCYCKHKRLLRSHCIVEETVCFRRDDVCGVLALVRYGWIVVPLECCIDIFVGERVEQEVRSGEASSMRLIVVGDFLGVEELADVVCIVASRLEPQRKVVLVEASGNELGVTT